MTEAAKRALKDIAKKNYMESLEKRKKEEEREQKELERMKKSRGQTNEVK